MIVLEPISLENVWRFKATRLQALQDAPFAFASTYAKEKKLSDADWLARAAQCANGRSIGYLAVKENVPCGIVRGTPDDKQDSVAWVESMWVAPAHRKFGVGRRLISAIVEWALSQNLSKLKLEVTSNNTSAIKFYEAVGFSPTGKVTPYSNVPTLDEYEMCRALRF